MHPYRTRLTVGLTASVLALAGCSSSSSDGDSAAGTGPDE